MDTLEAGLEALRSRAPSRGKFSFKKKVPTAASTPTTASGSTSTSATPAPPSSEPEKENRIRQPPDAEPWVHAMQHGRQFGNIQGGMITASSFFASNETDKKTIKAEVTLVSLRNCIINLLPGADPKGKEIVVTALYARDLRTCVILAGYIPGSVRLEKMMSGFVVVGCHQVTGACLAFRKEIGFSSFAYWLLFI